MTYVNGKQLTKSQRAEALRLYVHRFTAEHKPMWANEPRPDGLAYPVQFASDEEWLDNTDFPINKDGTFCARRSCRSNPTWPDSPELRGKWTGGGGMKKVKIGNKTFVERRDFAASVFEPGGTPNGFYVKRRLSVYFYDGNGEMFACLCAHDPSGCFFVNANARGKRIWHGLATNVLTEWLLGIEGLGYGASKEVAERVWKEVSE